MFWENWKNLLLCEPEHRVFSTARARLFSSLLYSLASYLLLNVGERLRDDKLCRTEQFPKSVEHFHFLTV